ncbi:MAG TPA: VgrG-related protein [Acidimicrobiales bacterium]|nr:VgrG-related protein [Acidimicrobiales bacterium]
MADQQTAGSVQISIDGTQLPDDVAHLLTVAIVDRNQLEPDLFVLRFRDPDRQILTKTKAKVGSHVAMTAFSTVAPGGEPLLSGDITALEKEFDASGTFVVVRGYDESHKLFRGRTSQTYQNMSYSDVAQAVAKRAGLTAGEIDATTPVYPWIAQDNSNDWQFLKRLANEVGYELSVIGGALNFRQPQSTSGAPPPGSVDGGDSPLQLTMGAQVLKLRGVISSSDQVSSIQVRGWDPIAKKPIVATAQAGTTNAKTAASPGDLASVFGGSSTLTSVGVPHANSDEATRAANALGEHIGGSFAELDGVARGNTKLAPGSAISLSLAGDPFDGQYVLTTTRHRFDPSDGYTTAFTVSGKNRRSLLGLTTGGGSGGGSDHRIAGVVSAIVTDVNDPQQLGRVKVSYPWLSDSYNSDWARMVQIGAGSDRGAVFLPEVGDEVIVAFEQGDRRLPLVIGSVHNGVDKPKVGDNLIDSTSGAVNRRGIVSKHGHMLVFFDGEGNDGVSVMTGDKSLKISLNQTGTTIKVSSNGTVEISGQSGLTIKSGGDIDVQATGKLSLQGSEVAISAQADVSVTGTPIKLN